MSTILYAILLSVALALVIAFFGYYLWKKLKEEKLYKTEALPGLEDLSPQDLVTVSTHSEDTSSLPSIEELEAHMQEEEPVLKPSIAIELEDIKEEPSAHIVNPFD